MDTIDNPSPIKSFTIGKTYYAYKDNTLIEFKMISETPQFIRFMHPYTNVKVQANKRFIFAEKYKLEYFIIQLQSEKIKTYNNLSARKIQEYFEDLQDTYETYPIEVGDFIFYSKNKDIKTRWPLKEGYIPFDIFNGVVESISNKFYTIRTMEGKKIRKAKKYVSRDSNEVEFNEWQTRKKTIEKYIGMTIPTFYKIADEILNDKIESFV